MNFITQFKEKRRIKQNKMYLGKDVDIMGSVGHFVFALDRRASH